MTHSSSSLDPLVCDMVLFIELHYLMRIAKIYSREVSVNEINGITNSDKFSRSYDDLYLDVTFRRRGRTRGGAPIGAGGFLGAGLFEAKGDGGT